MNFSAGSLFSLLGGLLGTPGPGMFSGLSGLLGGGPKLAVAPKSAGSSIMSAMSSILKSGKTGMAASRALENSAGSRRFAINNAEEIQAAAANSSSIFMAMINYDGLTPPRGALGKFETLKSTIDYTKTQSYSPVISMSGAAFDYLAMHISFRVSTFAVHHLPFKLTTSSQSISLPYQPNNPGYYAEIEDLWNSISQSYIKRAKGTVTATIAYQPFPRTIGQASEKHGWQCHGSHCQRQGQVHS